MFNYTFSWPAGPKDVILTGTFDDWRGTLNYYARKASQQG